jgi:hypothetical protein
VVNVSNISFPIKATKPARNFFQTIETKAMFAKLNLGTIDTVTFEFQPGNLTRRFKRKEVTFHKRKLG